VSTALPITFADLQLERRRVELQREEQANDRQESRQPQSRDLGVKPPVRRRRGL
jgi:hypothetical protein